MKRKALACFLVFSIVVSTFTACSSGAESSAEVPPADSSLESQPATAGGDAVTLVYYFKPVSDGNEQSDPDALGAVHDIIQADTGVDLQVIMGTKNDDDHTTKLNLLLSSGEQVDIFQDPWQPLHLKGFLADLTDYVDADAQAQEALGMFREETVRGVKADGRLMAFPLDDAGSVYPVWLREDFLNQYNLDVPKTMDELENALRTFKENDPVGGGKTMGLLTSARGIAYTFVGAFTENGMGRFLDSDGRINPYFMDPGYKDYIETMASWYDDGLIAPETFSYVRADHVEFIRMGQAASVADWYSTVTLSHSQFKEAFPTGDYVFLDGLTGPKGLAESVWPVIKPSVGERSSDGVCVNVNCSDIAAAVRVMSWGYLNDTYNFLTAFQGIEDVNWQWVDESTKTYQLIDDPQQKYLGEYNMYMSLVNELRVNSLDPTRLFHNEWLQNDGWYRYDNVKWSVDRDIVYNDEELKDNVPGYVDIMNFVQEEMVKFIMGNRSLDDWDNYMKQLEGMGVQQMIDELTRQYNELK